MKFCYMVIYAKCSLRLWVTAFYLCFLSKANLRLDVSQDCKKCALEEFTNFRTISDFILVRLEGKQAHVFSPP